MAQRHRGVVLKLHEAYAVHRWLEFHFMDRRFYNPIEAHEAKTAALAAMHALGEKLMRQFESKDQA
jgi:hypothetical protein